MNSKLFIILSLSYISICCHSQVVEIDREKIIGSIVHSDVTESKLYFLAETGDFRFELFLIDSEVDSIKEKTTIFEENTSPVDIKVNGEYVYILLSYNQEINTSSSLILKFDTALNLIWRKKISKMPILIAKGDHNRLLLLASKDTAYNDLNQTVELYDISDDDLKLVKNFPVNPFSVHYFSFDESVYKIINWKCPEEVYSYRPSEYCYLQSRYFNLDDSTEYIYSHNYYGYIDNVAKVPSTGLTFILGRIMIDKNYPPISINTFSGIALIQLDGQCTSLNRIDDKLSEFVFSKPLALFDTTLLVAVRDARNPDGPWYLKWFNDECKIKMEISLPSNIWVFDIFFDSSKNKLKVYYTTNSTEGKSSIKSISIPI